MTDKLGKIVFFFKDCADKMRISFVFKKKLPHNRPMEGDLENVKTKVSDF